MRGEIKPVTDGAMSNFARNVFSVLERTEYRRCERGDDLHDIYRLRYNSYKNADLVSESSDRMVYDEYDEKPNCYKLGVYIDANLVGTIRLHVVSKEQPWSPSVSVYPDILIPRLEAGERFIDPSRFAADLEWARIYPQIPYLILRLAGMACFYFNAPYVISMIRGDHVAFYKRIYNSRPIGTPRNYDGVINTVALLYEADVLAIQHETFSRFPFFQSSAREQRMLFSAPPGSLTGPLTVMPSLP
ncbi:N-acyl amino acid synthase FeeM domain-containing protein [Limoniibacter endophyticus]|uniref:N-acyl amino acid synthase FeeM catalytic core domain-containing protein n=1 Tax=Limoniibacter endophyticus TaxID=1565040 RepID=A0A8J3DGH3_9HYPH|nr:hypothetical protein [Limoniibacter endophyticus]GHC63958.1 hypothetical protein GCM10010136_05610 [Limoniibacter endophyticus]